MKEEEMTTMTKDANEVVAKIMLGRALSPIAKIDQILNVFGTDLEEIVSDGLRSNGAADLVVASVIQMIQQLPAADAPKTMKPAPVDRKPHAEKRPQQKPQETRTPQKKCEIHLAVLEEKVFDLALIVRDPDLFAQFCDNQEVVDKVVKYHLENVKGCSVRGRLGRVLIMFSRLTNLVSDKDEKRKAFLADQDIRRRLWDDLDKMFPNAELKEEQESETSSAKEDQPPAEQAPAAEESSTEAPEAKDDEDADEKSDEDLFTQD